MPEKEADEIISSIIARFKETTSEHRSMARASLVLDENINHLAGPLREANFRVRIPKKGMTDQDIKELMLDGAIFVTNNTKDFVDDAPIYDYGIIGLEAIYIDSASEYRKNTTAQAISRAVIDYAIPSMKTKFLLLLRPNGKHFFRQIG